MKAIRFAILIVTLLFVLLPGRYVSANNELVSSFSKTYQTTTTSTVFHLAIGLAAAVYVPEWEVWPGGPVVPARWDIDWQIAGAPTYKIFNHETPGAFLFEDITFNASSKGQTYTISSGSDDPDFDNFAAFLMNGTDDNIWEAWIWPMHPTNNAGGIRCAGGPQGFYFESDVFPGTDVGSDHPGWTIQSVSLTFDDITTSMLTIDYTVDITYGPTGNPGHPGAPTDFTLTLSGDNISANWTKGTSANTTLVMRQANRYPADVTDGVEAYSGNGTSFINSGLNVEDNEFFYRAWSHNDYGYSTDYAQGIIGGIGMLTIALAFIIVTLTVVALWRREPMLYVVGFIGWMFMTFYLVNQNYPPENAYLPWTIAVFCVSLALIMAVMVIRHYLSVRPKGPTSDYIQEEHRKKVLRLVRPKGKPWYYE